MTNHRSRISCVVCRDSVGLRNGLCVREETIVFFFAEGLITAWRFRVTEIILPGLAVKRGICSPGPVQIIVVCA